MGFVMFVIAALAERAVGGDPTAAGAPDTRHSARAAARRGRRHNHRGTDRQEGMNAHAAEEELRSPPRGGRGAPSPPPDAAWHCLRATAFGPVAVLWSAAGRTPQLRRVLLSRPGLPAPRLLALHFPDSTPAACREITLMLDRIEAFLGGEDVVFSLDAVRLDLCSPFQRRVLCADHAVPRGRISTYGLIARHVGNLDGARAVGRALATNPFPLIVPCHRVINADGTPGGYGGGVKMKRALLEMEGIVFGAAGRAVRDFFEKDIHSGIRPIGRMLSV